MKRLLWKPQTEIGEQESKPWKYKFAGAENQGVQMSQDK